MIDSVTLLAFMAVVVGTRHPGIGRWRGKVIGTIYVGLRLAVQQR